MTTDPTTTSAEPEHDAAGHRFVVRHAEGESVLSYRLPRPGVIDLAHTLVHHSQRGRGTGEALLRAALDFARGEELGVVPTCPYVRRWLDAHPDERAELCVEPGKP